MIKLNNSPESTVFSHQVFLIHANSAGTELPVNNQEREYILEKFNSDQRFIVINRYTGKLLVTSVQPTENENASLEAWRRQGNKAAQWIREEKIQSIQLISCTGNGENMLAFAEGLILGNYQFLKYNSNAEKIRCPLQEISFAGELITNELLARLAILTEAVYKARDLINEPVVSLNAQNLGEIFRLMAEETGIQAEIMGMEQIASLGMGGLLAVNRGSLDPPTFSVLVWKPEGAVNSQPVVLVGKGVVFDTGGLSLKPTAKSMDYMKCDMAGGAAVVAAIWVAAKSRLPLYLVALVPATDNRPGGNAITPGDVITISNGATVEVLNTDAEGRLILADALCFAKKYDPMLVIDLATLTGSAAMTLGIHGIAAMASQSEEFLELLIKAGDQVNERLVELPLWEEYDEMIKSNIADMKNIGGGEAGAITAGKFLQRFADYPWIHLDIAGPSFLHTADHYRTIGGTATGVRLLNQFFNLLIPALRSDSNS